MDPSKMRLSLSERVKILHEKWKSALQVLERDIHIKSQKSLKRLKPITDIIGDLAQEAENGQVLPKGVSLQYRITQEAHTASLDIIFSKGSKNLGSVKFRNSERSSDSFSASLLNGHSPFKNASYRLSSKTDLDQFKDNLEEWFVSMVANNFDIRSQDIKVQRTINPLENDEQQPP